MKELEPEHRQLRRGNETLKAAAAASYGAEFDRRSAVATFIHEQRTSWGSSRSARHPQPWSATFARRLQGLDTPHCGAENLLQCPLSWP